MTVDPDGDEAWLDRCTVRAQLGDILRADADAIVVPLKEGLIPYGTVCAAARAAYGARFDDALRRTRAARGTALGLGDTGLLDARELGHPHARHLIVVGFWTRDSDYTAALVEQAYAASFRCAFREGVRRLAAPIIGAGGWLRDRASSPQRAASDQLDEYARAIVSLLHPFDELPRSGTYPVEALTFVSPKEEHVERLTAVFDAEL